MSLALLIDVLGLDANQVTYILAKVNEEMECKENKAV
jgi:hypothetical protein